MPRRASVVRAVLLALLSAWPVVVVLIWRDDAKTMIAGILATVLVATVVVATNKSVPSPVIGGVLVALGICGIVFAFFGAYAFAVSGVVLVPSGVQRIRGFGIEPRAGRPGR
jgi:hypothetical protein